MYYQNFHILLTLVVIFVPFGFLITYLLAVFNDHAEAGFPYISDTGAFPPESCIFGQILTFGSFMVLTLVYVRYHHVKLCISHSEKWSLIKFNKIGVFFGITSCVGVTLVGNFQEQNVISVHLIGAFMAFIFLIPYCLIQTYLSHKLSYRLNSTKPMLILRIFLGILSVILVGTTIIFASIGSSKYHGNDAFKWMPDDGGFEEHVISTASEWALAITEMVFLFTFYKDFESIKVKHPILEDHFGKSDSPSS